jgi:TetR/AcrR family transcriptional repressor of lmrAB and yxaGH operons
VAKDTRDRMIDATVALLRSKGVAGTSFSDITEQSGAARGVIYHHFPEGKAQLVHEAVVRQGESVLGHLRGLEASSASELVDRFLEAVRYVVGESANGSSCAVAAAALEGSDPSLAREADGVFRAWVAELTSRLVGLGARRSVAADLATSMIVLLQGAHVLARASGTDDGLASSARVLRAATTILLAGEGAARGPAPAKKGRTQRPPR